MEKTKISIVIVDDSREFCDILTDYLSSEEDITISAIAKNGIEALELIQEKKPDLVVLDVIMPYLDGLAVLEKLNSMSIQSMPKIIVLSAVAQEKITQRAIELGADYYVTKPFDMDVLIKRIKQVFNNTLSSDEVKRVVSYVEPNETEYDSRSNTLSNLEMEITKIIHELGIPANIRGYLYLREAVTLVVNDTELMSAVTKELYPLVGRKYNTTAARVERGIRHAIQVSWGRGKVETINKLFGYPIHSEERKPTNTNFISMIADKLRPKYKIAN